MSWPSLPGPPAILTASTASISAGDAAQRARNREHGRCHARRLHQAIHRSVTGPEVVFCWQRRRTYPAWARFLPPRSRAAEVRQPRPGIENDLQTNGVLLNAEWARNQRQIGAQPERPTRGKIDPLVRPEGGDIARDLTHGPGALPLPGAVLYRYRNWKRLMGRVKS